MVMLRQPVPVSELPASESQPDWIWHGLLAKRCVTLLVGEWKAGKTTLLSIVLSRFVSGGTVAGRVIRPSKAVIITEEPESLWRERYERLNFDPRLMILSRPFAGRPTCEEWIELMNDLSTADRLPDLIVLDPLAMFLPEHAESYAPFMLDALNPLHNITMRGCAILLNHHPCKLARRNHLGRGTAALHGFVDIDAKLLLDPGGRSDRVRRLVVKSRMFGFCTDHSIELTPDGRDYVVVPSGPTVGGWTEGIAVTQSILSAAGQPLTTVDIWKGWHEDFTQPALKTLRHWLWMAHADGLLERSGTGHRNDGFKYWVKGKMPALL